MFGRDERVPQGRVTAVQYGILAVFLLLAFGLWRLQIVGGDYYEQLAEKNRIRTVPILAPRGKIVDRDGRTIVDNYPSFSALLLRDQDRNLDDDIELIASGLHMDPEDVRDRIKHFATVPHYQPIILKDDITPDELAFIEAHRNELPELDTIMAYRRLYPKDGFMAHLIGYVGEVSEDMLNRPQWELYDPGDVVGQSGVEQYYNDILMGKNGSRRVLVNSMGREVDRLGQTPAVPGKELRLTIDLDLQIAAEQALGDRAGAVVAIDPHTGEILAMVSRPTFDPNAFAVHISRQEWNRLVTDDGNPLLNKAIQAQLAPGSVFKIIMAVAGLQEHIAQDMKVNCPGGAVFYGRYFKCWITAEHRTHGVVDIAKAIYQSCDTFFYTLADRLGIDRIHKYATEFGLGKKTDIDLPNEASGLVPSEKWKIRNYRQKWYAGETISVGIGQGAVTVTPIQLVRAIAGVATGGELERPHVAFPDDLSKLGRPVSEDLTRSEHVQIDPVNWEVITDAMASVPSPIGTAGSAHLEGIDFAGKTGSAQTISNATKAKLGAEGRKFKDNAWFVGFTPRRNPEVVVAVLYEGGEHGQFAARIAAQVVRAYVEKKHNPQQITKLAVAAPGMERFAEPSPETDRPQLAGITPAASVAANIFRHTQPSEVEAGKWQDSNESEMAAMWTRRDLDGHEMLSAGRFPLAQWAK
jgi:penicillin-binding protein 2